MHTNILTMIYIYIYIYINLFCRWRKVFIHTNTDDRKEFSKTSLSKKEDFYSHPNMKDINDKDWTHAKRVCKELKVKDLGEFHDLYV